MRSSVICVLEGVSKDICVVRVYMCLAVYIKVNDNSISGLQFDSFNFNSYLFSAYSFYRVYVCQKVLVCHPFN